MKVERYEAGAQSQEGDARCDICCSRPHLSPHVTIPALKAVVQRHKAYGYPASPSLTYVETRRGAVPTRKQYQAKALKLAKAKTLRVV